jgi:hypothetical protein
MDFIIDAISEKAEEKGEEVEILQSGGNGYVLSVGDEIILIQYK